jgi:hypothetical protein
MVHYYEQLYAIINHFEHESEWWKSWKVPPSCDVEVILAWLCNIAAMLGDPPCTKNHITCQMLHQTILPTNKN